MDAWHWEAVLDSGPWQTPCPQLSPFPVTLLGLHAPPVDMQSKQWATSTSVSSQFSGHAHIPDQQQNWKVMHPMEQRSCQQTPGYRVRPLWKPMAGCRAQPEG